MSKPYKYEGPLTGNRVTDNPRTPVVPVEPHEPDLTNPVIRAAYEKGMSVGVELGRLNPKPANLDEHTCLINRESLKRRILNDPDLPVEVGAPVPVTQLSRAAPVPVVEPRPSEPLLMLNALKAVKKLFSDDSKFYIKKLGSPITNGDQAEIDAVFIAVDQAITANERLGERGCCQYCGADRSGPSAEAHSNDCPAAAPPQVPSPAIRSPQESVDLAKWIIGYVRYFDQQQEEDDCCDDSDLFTVIAEKLKEER